MAEHPGPCYLRTLRPDVPFLYDADTKFELGGHHVLEAGTDLVILTAGYMVHEALKAVKSLNDLNIRPTLIDLYSLPFDADAVAALIEHNAGLALTVEDNYGAGIGSAVADVLAERATPHVLRQMYVKRIPKSGRTPDAELTMLGLSATEITEAAVALTNQGPVAV
jgi:transketolase